MAYYNACEVSASTKNTTTADLITANKNIWKLKSECLSLKVVYIQHVKDNDLGTIVCFSVESFALQTLKITLLKIASYIFLYKNNKSFSPIAQKSRKIKSG